MEVQGVDVKSILEAKTTMDRLDEIAPGSSVVNTDQIAIALGKTGKGGPQTVRNQISKKQFPLHAKLRKNGAHWILSKVVFAAWIDGEDDAAPAVIPPPKRGPGRPRKSVEQWLAALDDSWASLLSGGRQQLDDDPGILEGSGRLEARKM